MDYTIVGKIINTHGIKGEIKIYPMTNNLERFDILKSAYIGEKKIKVELERVRYSKNIVILKLKEFDDINEVIEFKDEYLYVDEEQKIVLPDWEFFIYDLVGSKVVDKSFKFLGILTDILQGASNDVYVIQDELTKKQYLIPAVKEFIIDVDIEKKLIIVDPIEGMIE